MNLIFCHDTRVDVGMGLLNFIFWYAASFGMRFLTLGFWDFGMIDICIVFYLNSGYSVFGCVDKVNSERRHRFQRHSLRTLYCLLGCVEDTGYNDISLHALYLAAGCADELNIEK